MIDAKMIRDVATKYIYDRCPAVVGVGKCGLSGNREFKQRSFWATHVNWKWAFFSVDMPWCYQICIAKCFYSYRDDLPKHLFKITAVKFKKSISGWRESLKNVVALTPY